MAFGAQQTQQAPPFKRRRDTCTFSTPDFDYTFPKPKSFKRRKRSFRSSMTWQAPTNTFTPHDQIIGEAEMQTPASPPATTPRDDEDEFKNDHDPTKRRDAVVADTKTDDSDTIHVASKPRSSLASNLANMSLPLPEDVEELKSRFLSMCSTLVDYSENRNELIKKNERLQCANDDLTETLSNRNGHHKQQMQRVQDESDRVGIELTKAQQRNTQFEEELAQARERAKQLEVQLQQDFKEHNTQHEKDVKEYSRLEQDKIQLEIDLRDAKQQGEVNKNRYELELRKRGEQAKDMKKKDTEITERNSTIDALRKIVAAKDKVRLEKEQEANDLRHTLQRTDDSLKRSLAHHRFVLPVAMNAQSDLAYAEHSLSLAHNESDEYAFANIGALVRTATARGQELREQIDVAKRVLEAKDREVAQLKADTLCLNKSLGDANGLAETEKLAKVTANAELDRLGGELKDLKTKHEAAQAEANTWRDRYTICERHLAKTNADKDALSKEKERLLNSAGELDSKLAERGLSFEKLMKMPDELAELKKKLATAEANVKFWKNAHQEGVRLATSKAATEKDAFVKEKEQLLARNRELDQQISSAKRTPETRTASAQCELASSTTVNDDQRCGSQCQAKLPSYACMGHLEQILGDVSLATQVRELYRQDVERHLEIRIDGKVLPHPQTKPRYRRSDEVKYPLDDLMLLARILDVYRADVRLQIEVRVASVIIFRGFNIPENRMKHYEDAQLLMDGPLLKANTVTEEIILSNKPWNLSPIDFALDELTEPGRYDLSILPEAQGQNGTSANPQNEDEGDGVNTFDTFSEVNSAAARQMSIGSVPPAPEFMQGANIIRTRESIDASTVNEELSKKPSFSPTTLKGASIQRLEIPKQRNPQPQSVARATSLEPSTQQNRPQPQSAAIPTPVSFAQASPRDSVLMTPRSPMEGEINRKRPASQERNNEPKRHAPSDPVRDAPKQPRNYDARLEYQQERAYRGPAPSELKKSHGGREYDSYKPGSDASRPPPRRETDEDRERDRRRTAECYGRRWDR